MTDCKMIGKVSKHAMVLVCTALLAACAGGLRPVDAPVEMTPAPSEAAQWLELESLRDDNWFHVLNLGSEAFDWRLRAIDSATDSIDLQTFIWDLDAAGHQVRDHLLAAASRGVFVRVLVGAIYDVASGKVEFLDE